MGLSDTVLLRVAGRWIAGTDLESAMVDAKKANEKGLGAIVNYLGEEITDPSVAEAHLAQYLRLQETMKSEGVRGFVSVKLTQFGLGMDEGGARNRLEKAVVNSERLGQQLWMDMEGSKFTDKTLQMYLEVLDSHKQVGVALQSYLRRSESDLKGLLDRGGRVRLVKGAYREPPEVAFPSRREVTANYSSLMKILFERGDHFAIATHDGEMVDEAKRLAGSSHADFEFEMLKGIRDDLKKELVSSGYKVSEYLPYGEEWYPYSKRRLSEHPSNVLLLLRSLV